MAVCDYCNKEMAGSKTCKETKVKYPDGTALACDTTHFDEPSGHCHDCGVKHGGRHHPGCDVERCPRCGGQLISCGCLDAED